MASKELDEFVVKNVKWLYHSTVNDLNKVSVNAGLGGLLRPRSAYLAAEFG